LARSGTEKPCFSRFQTAAGRCRRASARSKALPPPASKCTLGWQLQHVVLQRVGEQRHAYFEAVGHAGAVGLGQAVFGEVGPQVGAQQRGAVVAAMAGGELAPGFQRRLRPAGGGESGAR
jgi:hypothetical protein